ncbi:hypothetical protein HYH03_007061 [Edaphochlamys debaryana]|uniref:Uncharacterized protein n=1 Tax=Edaphochlamys debaryana TaxID=47281 RepID=A0A835Y431_9CHLO|nr:hypothetical protein HYH03_007061 [Edaphochlamys debaryana]|eukprot:KAG2494819.1 hypothetical protein HYH03_007061 [Edaphochlamys debaryana]
MSSLTAALSGLQEQRRRRLAVGALLAEYAPEQPQRAVRNAQRAAERGEPANASLDPDETDGAAAATTVSGLPRRLPLSQQAALAALRRSHPTAVLCTQPRRALLSHVGSAPASGGRRAWHKLLPWLLPVTTSSPPPNSLCDPRAPGLPAQSTRHDSTGPQSPPCADPAPTNSNAIAGDLLNSSDTAAAREDASALAGAEVEATASMVLCLLAHDPNLEPDPNASSTRADEPAAHDTKLGGWDCDHLTQPAPGEEKQVTDLWQKLARAGIVLQLQRGGPVESGETADLEPAAAWLGSLRPEHMTTMIKQAMMVQQLVCDMAARVDSVTSQLPPALALRCQPNAWRRLDMPAAEALAAFRAGGVIGAELEPGLEARCTQLLELAGRSEEVEQVARLAVWCRVLMEVEGILPAARPLVCAAAGACYRALEVIQSASYAVSASLLYYELCAGVMPPSPGQRQQAAALNATPLSIDHLQSVISRQLEHPAIPFAWAQHLFMLRSGDTDASHATERYVCTLDLGFLSPKVRERMARANQQLPGQTPDAANLDAQTAGSGGGSAHGPSAPRAAPLAEAKEPGVAEKAAEGEPLQLGPAEVQLARDIVALVRELVLQPDLRALREKDTPPGKGPAAADGSSGGSSSGRACASHNGGREEGEADPRPAPPHGQQDMPPPIRYTLPSPEACVVLTLALLVPNQFFAMQPAVLTAAAGGAGASGRAGASGGRGHGRGHVQATLQGPAETVGALDLALWRGFCEPNIGDPAGPFDRKQLKIFLVRANGSVATEARELSSLLLKRRQCFCWVQGEGVAGVWKALQVLAKVRAEMLALGRDLAATVTCASCFGDGSSELELAAQEQRERERAAAEEERHAGKHAKSGTAAPPDLVPTPAGLSMRAVAERMSLCLADLAGLPPPGALVAPDQAVSPEQELTWQYSAEQNACRLLQRLLCKGEGGGPSYRDRVRVEFAVFECGLGRPHEPVLPPIPEKRRLEGLRMALGVGT